MTRKEDALIATMALLRMHKPLNSPKLVVPSGFAKKFLKATGEDLRKDKRFIVMDTMP